MTTVGKFVTQNAVWSMEKIGLVPKGTHDVGEALKTAADALVAGGREKLFTPMMVSRLIHFRAYIGSLTSSALLCSVHSSLCAESLWPKHHSLL